MKVIKVGAEATIFEDKNRIIKERRKKSYRINEIDEKIRKYNTRKEARLLERAFEVVDVPKVIEVNEDNKKMTLENIKGKVVRDVIEKIDEKEMKRICNEIGRNIAKLHDKDIIHGDLTTANFIFFNDKVYFIDFGLGFMSKKIEDKAVDIHLLKQVLQSRHYKIADVMIKEILNGYRKSITFEEVIERLEKVESRGRYKRKKLS